MAQRGNNIPAVEKLCTNITDANRLEQIATKLLLYTDNSVIQAFLGDINCQNNIANAPNNSRSICNFVGSLSLSLIDAWKICKEARPTTPSIRLDWDILQSVAHYQTSASIKESLTITGASDGINDRFLKMLDGTNGFAGGCSTCNPVTTTACEKLPMMNIYLETLKAFAIKYRTKSGFDTFIKAEATATGPKKQDGAYHLMRDLNKSSYSSSNVESFEGIIKDKMQGFLGTTLCNGCSYDVEKPANILVDYKSYDCSTGIKAEQFKQYLQYWSSGGIGANGNVIPPREFEYIFNSDKLTLEEAKKKFVTLLKSDPTGFYNVNPAFFNRITLADGITPISNVNDFIIELNKANFWQNNIFNFVTIIP